jgi:hypothetical protein
MASIGPVNLAIFDQPPGEVLVQVSYTISQTLHDAQHEQAYRELVEIIGVDTGEPGEDGVDDVLPGATIWDGVAVFTTSQVSFTVTRERRLPAAALDEDTHPFLPRSDELRARVTLTPLATAAPVRESNLIRREQVLGPVG